MIADYQLLLGDALTVLRTLPAGSVQMCVTSPPYYGLRSYLPGDHPDKALEIGMEQTPEAFVANLVDVFREVKRVLRDDGTCWVNLGDSYNGSGGAGGDYGVGGLKEGQPKYPGRRVDGLKPKDLIGIPWMVAFALRADGWYLRSDIIWSKPNPMPESVTDRPTKSHEYIFLLSKSSSYFYDADGIREITGNEASTDEYKSTQRRRDDMEGYGMGHTGKSAGLYGERFTHPMGRNKRSVWTVATKPYAGAHFATFPPELIEPCILAGTSAHGCCAACGAPWERVVEHGEPDKETTRGRQSWTQVTGQRDSSGGLPVRERTTVDWQPTCDCNAPVIPCTVLDPFCGSGTTLSVALKLGRRGIAIDLNPDYLELAHDRIRQTQPPLLQESA